MVSDFELPEQRSHSMLQYMIINLGMSKNFGDVDFPHLTFPQTMKVDYVRIYQPVDKTNIGCDPAGFSTSDYIER